MSVRTTFDDKRDEAKAAIARAIESLLVCVNEDTYGYGDIRPEYIDDLITITGELIKIKRKI